MGGLWRIYRSCATAFFTVQLIVLLAVGWTLVSAGAVTVPVLSDLAGPRPAPSPTAAPDPRPGEAVGTLIVLEVSEDEVNALLAAQQAGSPVATDVTLQIHADGLTLNAALREPVPARVQAWGTLVAVDGRPRLSLEGAKAGILPLPRTVVDVLEGIANEPLAELVAAPDFYVEDVELRPGLLRLIARAQMTP